MVRVPKAGPLIRCTKAENWRKFINQQQTTNVPNGYPGGQAASQSHHFTHFPAQGSLGPQPGQLMAARHLEEAQAAQAAEAAFNFNSPPQMNAYGPLPGHVMPQHPYMYPPSGAPVNHLQAEPANSQSSMGPWPLQSVDSGFPNFQTDSGIFPQPPGLYSNDGATEHMPPLADQPLFIGQMLTTPASMLQPGVSGQSTSENMSDLLMNKNMTDGLTPSHKMSAGAHSDPNLYFMPLGSATAEHPFTVEQVPQYQKSAQYIPQEMLNRVPTGIAGEAALSAEGYNAPGSLHNCVCGPDCQCMICLAHPYNNVTQQTVRQLAKIAVQDQGRGNTHAQFPPYEDNGFPPNASSSGDQSANVDSLENGDNATDDADARRSTPHNGMGVLSGPDDSSDPSGTRTAPSNDYHTIMSINLEAYVLVVTDLHVIPTDPDAALAEWVFFQFNRWTGITDE
ncbi:MAG: hypothetical protein Q9222_003198 [Ikaeria aurantiellina]